MALTDYYRAQQDVALNETKVESYQRKVAEIQNDFNTYSASTPTSEANDAASVDQIQQRLTTAQSGLESAQADLNASRSTLDSVSETLSEDPTQTIKTLNAINPSQSDLTSLDKVSTGDILGTGSADFLGASFDIEEVQAGRDAADKASELLREGRRGIGGLGARGVPPGAQKTSSGSTKVSFKDASGKTKFSDTRVKIRVPDTYLVSSTNGPNSELYNIGGIVFPYTPSITMEHKAEYQTITPTHSNFPINFYSKSGISNISINGKFTVQNDTDAAIYISTIRLLRALTKMKFGNDINAGSPPPVCRLDAFGSDILMNVPVAISSFRLELPDNVDYYTYGKNQSTDDITSVPVISTVSLTLVPMYSRSEMQKFSVDDFLNTHLNLSKQGYV